MKIFILKLAAPLFAIFALAACGGSEPPTFGERLSDRGGDVQKIGEQWSEGNALVLDGKKLLKEGQDETKDAQEELDDARAKVSKGQSMITKGINMKNNAESIYQQKYHSPLIE